MSRAKRKLSLPLTLLLCAVVALTTWTVPGLTKADTANASADGSVCSLSVGGTEIWYDFTYLDPTLPAGVTYDKDENILTLENMTVASGEDFGGIGYSGSKDLTIHIKGTVNIGYSDDIAYSGYKGSGSDPSTSGASIRIIGDGQGSSNLVQQSNEKYQYTFFCFGAHDNEDTIDPMDVSNVSFEDLSIQSTGGLDSDYTNVSFKNCKWTMDGGDAPIRMRTSGGAGNLSVNNSTIQMRSFKKTSEFPYAIACRSLTLTGVSFYAGANISKLQTTISPTSSSCKWNGYAAYQISPASQAMLWRKLTFNGNTGKAAGASMWVKAGTSIADNGKLPTATKKHYKLAGWYTKKSGGTKITSSYKPSKDMTLYAHWKVAGKKKKVKLVTSLKCNGTTYKVSYYKNGMIKKITGGGSKRTFAYDDQLRYAKANLYQSHYKSARKPMFEFVFNYSTKKAKWKNHYYGDTWTVKFKTNKKGQFTYFYVSDTGEKHTYKYNKKGHLISEIERDRGKKVLTATYKRNSKGLIKSVNYWYKYDGRSKGRYKYSMKSGVPTRFSATVSGYSDKGTYRYTTKTVRDWQKKIIMRQQRMLYYIDYSWGDAMFALI